MAVACQLQNIDLWIALQHIERLEIGTADVIHFARGDRTHARGDVGNRDELDFIEIGLAALEVTGIAFELGRDAGLKILEDESAGADARLPVCLAIGTRHYAEMIVAQYIGKICIAALERENNRFRPVRL